MTDNDFVEFNRAFSPDSSMVLIHYGIDIGALGYAEVGIAILKLRKVSRVNIETGITNGFADIVCSYARII